MGAAATPEEEGREGGEGRSQRPRRRRCTGRPAAGGFAGRRPCSARGSGSDPPTWDWPGGHRPAAPSTPTLTPTPSPTPTPILSGPASFPGSGPTYSRGGVWGVCFLLAAPGAGHPSSQTRSAKAPSPVGLLPAGAPPPPPVPGQRCRRLRPAGLGGRGPARARVCQPPLRLWQRSPRLSTPHTPSRCQPSLSSPCAVPAPG